MPSKCILRPPSSHGYAYVTVGGKKVGAHRAAWSNINGPIPVGMFICHHCDVRNCVNVEHLFLGTAKDNSQDCARKGRLKSQKCPPKGELNHRAQLTTDQVLEILRIAEKGPGRQRRRRGIRQTLSNRYGVSVRLIKHILDGTSWRHVR